MNKKNDGGVISAVVGLSAVVLLCGCTFGASAQGNGRMGLLETLVSYRRHLGSGNIVEGSRLLSDALVRNALEGFLNDDERDDKCSVSDEAKGIQSLRYALTPGEVISAIYRASESKSADGGVLSLVARVEGRGISTIRVFFVKENAEWKINQFVVSLWDESIEKRYQNEKAMFEFDAFDESKAFPCIVETSAKMMKLLEEKASEK